MATDPAQSIFTFHQPFEEIQSTEPALPENPIPGHFEQIPLKVEQNPPPYLNHHSGLKLDDLFDLEAPLPDPFSWALCNSSQDDETVNFQSCSGLPGEGCSNPAGLLENCNGSQNPAFGDNYRMASLGFSERPASQNYCCLALRQITHINGMHVKRLEILGSLGVITHAILEKFDFDSSVPSKKQWQLFDFQNEIMPPAKEFLVQYFRTCKQEGYNPVQDPLSTFYQILSVGLNDSHHQNNDIRSSPEKTGGSNQRPGRFNKEYSLKEQRERTRKMKLTDFGNFIHLPIETAAREMNLCQTALKKFCRGEGVERWPYRKIRSLQSKIAKNHEILEEGGADEKKATALEDIQNYEEELAGIYEPFTQ